MTKTPAPRSTTARARRALGAKASLAAVAIGVPLLIAGPALASTTSNDYSGNDNGKLTCPDGFSLYKQDGNEGNTFGGVKFTVREDTYLSFTSATAGQVVALVSVKGGTNYRVFTFDPAATSGSDMNAPINRGGNIPEISHWSACVGTAPEAPVTTVPETTVPEQPETTVPETTVPEQPETTVPETTVPEQPETTVPEATVPETTDPQQPETTVAQPEATVPEASTPDVTVSGPELTPLAPAAPTTAPATVIDIPDQLPVTGSNTMAWIMTAAGLVAAGGGLLLLTRRSSER